MSFYRVFTGLSATVLCLLSLAAPAAVEYTITDLGPFDGGDRSGAYGLNNGGTAVGSAFTADDTMVASFWIGGVISAIDTSRSRAHDINASDQICGESYFAGATHHAFRYVGGVMTDLGTLGGTTSRAYAINSAGQVVGWAETTGSDLHAFLWLETAAYGLSAGMNDLGTLSGYTRSEAYDVNDSGQTVGQASTGSMIPTSSPFLWLPTAAYGLPSGLNDLGDLGGSNGKAEGINSLGQTCGWSTISDVGWNVHAFLWLPSADYGLAAGLNDLGALHAGDTAYAYARAVNENGIVVGAAGPDDSTSPSAFIWDAVGGMRDLNGLIDPTLGWGQLWEAWDVNDAGQIAGRGLSPCGEVHGFLLTPIPEPGTLCLVTLGGLLVSWSRKRRRAKASHHVVA